ncbi:MAG: hypothetical protein AAF311_00625 [Pseudomonadota bacterium]
MMRYGVCRLLIAIILGFPTACAHAPDMERIDFAVAPKPSVSLGPDEDWVVVGGRHTGVLHLSQSCLYLKQGRTRHFLLWSHQHSLLEADGRVGVRWDNGSSDPPVAFIGERVHVGGTVRTVAESQAFQRWNAAGGSRPDCPIDTLIFTTSLRPATE